MLEKSIPVSKHPKSESNHLSKCTNSNSNSLDVSFWPPSPAVIDGLISKLKDRDGDMESNWEKIILNFKKELDLEQQQQLEEEQIIKSQPSSSGVDNNNGGGGGCGGGGGVRAKFSVPLSRREMEKDFEDMGERRLPRKPKKRPKVVQNQLDVSTLVALIVRLGEFDM
ncbi:hypothetical protein Tco_1003140 [Tanacetum coccineum]|uniref:Uncharacterized protein n=1 Tax=Tanacetum coccineum TaxID=301880 RepID=A0ABQ5FA47_9ASTR